MQVLPEHCRTLVDFRGGCGLGPGVCGEFVHGSVQKVVVREGVDRHLPRLDTVGAPDPDAERDDDDKDEIDEEHRRGDPRVEDAAVEGFAERRVFGVLRG
eukprot:3316033-Rhodomonas_salina.1